MTAATPSQPPAAAAPRPGAPSGPRGGRPQPPTIDPLRIIRQHAWLLAGAAGAGLVLGAIGHFACMFLYPLWGSTVVFEVRPAVSSAKDATTRDMQDEDVARLAQTEGQRMTSNTVLETAMKAPDVASTAWGQYYSNVDDRAKELREELRTGLRRGTQLFTLSWRTWEKGDVAVVLNRVADTYMTVRDNEENERAARSKSQFEVKRTAVEDQIRNLKVEVQDFIRKNGITSGTEGGLTDQGTSTNLAKLRDDTVRDLTLAQSRLDNIDRKIADQRFEDEDRRISLDDPSIKQMERDLQQIQIALSASRERFGEAHPQVKDLMQREAAGRARMKSAMDEAMMRNLLADKINYSQRVTALKSLVERQTQDLTDSQKRLQELTAQISALDALKEQLAQKEIERKDLQDLITQIDLLQSREDSRRVRIVQRASAPREMEFPRLELMLPGGAILGLLVVAGVLFLREFLDQRVKQPSDLAGVGGARLVGVIPDVEDDPAEPASAELVVLRTPMSTTAEMFRQFASATRKAMDAGGLRTIAVVTAHPQGGSTTAAANLAASLRAVGRSVAVVDANLRRPRLASLFGADPDAPGLGDMLMGRNAKPQMVDGIAVFGPGTPDSRVFERLSTDDMRRLLAQLREQYQVVIVDLPPALVAGESMTVADCCDSAVLVVRAMVDQRGLVAKLVHQLHETKAVLIGTLLMRPEQVVGGYFKKNAALMAEYGRKEQPEASAQVPEATSAAAPQVPEDRA